MSVVPLTQAPRARRARAVLGRTLADAAGLHGAERELFALLVRLSYRPGPVARRRAWLAEHLGVSDRTVRRAVAALEGRELVAVVHGTGRTPSTYTLDLPALLTRLTPPVHPAELTRVGADEGGQNVLPGGTKCPPRGDRMTSQGGQDVLPLRARDARDARESPDTYQFPLTPSAAPERAAGRDAGGSPPGTPPPRTEGDDDRCRHGRTRRQGCRSCGTDTRTATRAAARAAADAERAEREAARAADRAAAAELTPPPAGFRALVHQATRAREDITP